MEIIQELNGWTLTKASDGTGYSINHPDGHVVKYPNGFQFRTCSMFVNLIK